MNKKYLIKNQEEFQGEKYLFKAKDYFEGWYFKQTTKDEAIALIPGINIEGNKKKAFIQVITKDKSYFIDYKMEDFYFQYQPFQIRIGKNFFSKEKIIICIHDFKNQLTLEGTIKYSQSQNIKTNLLQPNIMGFFSYLPFLECHHAIISMKNKTQGTLTINGQSLNFDSGTGYIEKDWGISFPSKYIWCQGNQFSKNQASFLLAIATVPFKIFQIKGLICSFLFHEKEYRFATYNFAKIKKYQANPNQVSIILKKGKYTLTIKSICDSSQKLVAPIKGKMQKEILESITATIHLTLKKKKEVLFSDVCHHCGLEIVN